MVKDYSALAAGVRERRIELESSIDIASAAAAVLLNVIVVYWAVLFVFISISLAHEEVGWYPLGLTAQAKLKRILLHIVYLPSEENLVRSFG